MRDKGIEERVVKGIAFGMVLHAEAEGVIAEPGLLDDIVVGAPRLDFQAGAELVERLMVRAVDGADLQFRPLLIAQALKVLELEVVVVRDVEMKRATECNIENLESAANGEDGQALLKDERQEGKFPRIAAGIGILDQAGIGHGLMEKIAGDIEASREQQAMDTQGHHAATGVPKADVGIGTKNRLKKGFIDLPNPCGDLFQPASIARIPADAY